MIKNQYGERERRVGCVIWRYDVLSLKPGLFHFRNAISAQRFSRTNETNAFVSIQPSLCYEPRMTSSEAYAALNG